MSRNRKEKARSGLSNKAKKKLLAEAKQRRQNPKLTRAETVRQTKEKKEDAISAALVKRKQLDKNPIQAIEQIVDGKITSVTYKSKYWAIKELISSEHDTQLKQAVKQLLIALENKDCSLLEVSNVGDYIRAIKNLARFRGSWIRSLDTWECRTRNRNKQFQSLIRHLLAKYDVPNFFDEVWFRDARAIANPRSHLSATIFQEWWVFIANGGNIRKAPKLPLALTKRMAHCMMESPNDYSVDAAFRWGQIHALGGNRRNADAIRETFLCQGYYENDEFWQSVFRYFINNPMLDTAQYGTIIDYIRNQKFITPLGAETPPQPNLQMKDRNPETLIRQVDEWHNQLIRQTKKRSKKPNSWEHHEFIADISKFEGKKDDLTEYRVVQLLTADELSAEGRRLNHCVSSYAWSCADGRTSIWSVRQMQPGDCWECLGTVEVNNNTGTVVQFKAKRNMQPTVKAHNIMQYWANKNGVKISNWI